MPVRKSLVAIAPVLVALSFPAGAAAADYARVTVQAEFLYTIDYGEQPDSVFNDIFFRVRSYQMRAIVVHDRSGLSIRGRNAVVAGRAGVADNRTVVEDWAAQPRRRVPIQACHGPGSADYGAPGSGPAHIWSSQTGGPPYDSTRTPNSPRFVGSRGAISVSGGRLKIDPGDPIDWNVGCSATEGPLYHALEEGPSFDVDAPRRSSFRGRKAFSKHCEDRFEHPMDATVNGHAFDGLARIKVTFRPFPKKKLATMRNRLRSSIGKRGSASFRGSGDACL